MGDDAGGTAGNDSSTVADTGIGFDFGTTQSGVPDFDSTQHTTHEAWVSSDLSNFQQDFHNRMDHHSAANSHHINQNMDDFPPKVDIVVTDTNGAIVTDGGGYFGGVTTDDDRHSDIFAATSIHRIRRHYPVGPSSMTVEQAEAYRLAKSRKRSIIISVLSLFLSGMLCISVPAIILACRPINHPAARRSYSISVILALGAIVAALLAAIFIIVFVAILPSIQSASSGTTATNSTKI